MRRRRNARENPAVAGHLAGNPAVAGLMGVQLSSMSLMAFPLYAFVAGPCGEFKNAFEFDDWLAQTLFATGPAGLAQRGQQIKPCARWSDFSVGSTPIADATLASLGASRLSLRSPALHRTVL